MRRLITVLSLVALSAGCYFLVEGQEEGRPCKNGRCPFGFVCIDDRCERVGDDNGPEGECAVATDCSCESGDVPACGEDEKCRCIVFHGRLDGVGGHHDGGRFGLVGGRLGPVQCAVSSEPEVVLCGGLTQ